MHINKSFTFNEQCEIILTKANQKFGILKRTCHFVTCKNRRRVLYLALVRSQFEHCSPVWRQQSITMINKFESFQKKFIKWILSEEEKSYSHEVYVSDERRSVFRQPAAACQNGTGAAAFGGVGDEISKIHITI